MGDHAFFVEKMVRLVYSIHARGEIMLLTIDVGNSNTVFMIYHGDDRLGETRVITKKEDSLIYYCDVMKSLDYPITDVIVSCVVPFIASDIELACKHVFNITPKIVSGKNIIGFEIRLDNPLEIGADFIATSVGALEKYDAPVIVADIGSASKLTYTSLNYVFEGGLILPGLGTSLKALTEYIPHLPEVSLLVPEQVVGTSTIGAIQSGVMYGIIAQIEGLAKRIESEKGQKCVKILTGGYACLIKDYLPEFIYDETLLSDGLKTIVEKGMIK